MAMQSATSRFMSRGLLSSLLAPMLFSATALADPTPAKSITHPQSGCIVEQSAGEYPQYVVKRDGRTVYAPKSDGITRAIFSPNGRHIAFSGSEISGVDIKGGAFKYSVVVLDCETGALQGFEKGIPAGDLSWRGNASLRFTDAATGKQVDLDL